MDFNEGVRLGRRVELVGKMIEEHRRMLAGISLPAKGMVDRIDWYLDDDVDDDWLISSLRGEAYQGA